MTTRMRASPCLALALGVLLGVAAPAAGWAQAVDQQSLADWSQAAARGLFDLCRAHAPDAADVVDHGEVWGWPRFIGYQEAPEGYRREAGGQSRRTYKVGAETASVDATVQSGEVTSVAPARIRYFRCNVASDQPIDKDLEAYFAAFYGAPTQKTDKATVWLLGAAAGAAGLDDDAALKAVVAGGPGARGQRIELSRELDRDRAKLTLFQESSSP